MKRTLALLLMALLLLSGCAGAAAPSDPPAAEQEPVRAETETAPTPAEPAGNEEIPLPPEPEPQPQLPEAFAALPDGLGAAAAEAKAEGRAALVWLDPPEEFALSLSRLETEESAGGEDVLFLALEEDTCLRLIRGEPVFNESGVAVGGEGHLAAELRLAAGEGVWIHGVLGLGVPLYHLEAETPAGKVYCGLSRRMHSLLDGPLGLAPGIEQSSPPEYGAADYVENSLHYTADYWDDFGNHYRLAMDAPRLKLEGQDARVVNEELVLRAAREVRLLQEAQNRRTSPAVWDMDYVAICSPQGVLSVLLRIRGDGDWMDYSVYALDLATGRRLRDEELIALRAAELGVDPESWWPEAREAALEGAFRPHREEWAAMEPEERTFTEEQWALTLSDPHDLTRLYFDGEGRLCMVAPVYSMAGADWYLREILVG